jgi:hypothetical protein
MFGYGQRNVAYFSERSLWSATVVTQVVATAKNEG